MSFKQAAELIKEGKVKVVGQSEVQIVVEAGDHIVTFNKKPGRIIATCSCQNHARFCKEGACCSHKLAASTYCTMRRVKL